MRVEIIRDRRRFYEISSSWEEIYRHDSVVSINKSWSWMKGWLETTDMEWLILAVRKGSPGHYVSFFPLACRRSGGGKIILYPGGYPLAAHAGFVCADDYAREVLPALSSYIEGRLSWSRIELRDIGDPRMDLFTGHYQGQGRRFRVSEHEPTVCPYVLIPKGYDNYLEEFMGRETRKTLKKKLRRIERSKDIRISEPNDHDIVRHIDVLLDLWQRRWGRQPRLFCRQVAGVLRSSYEAGSLCLQFMWLKDVPVAGIATYMDAHKRTAQCFMSAYDESVRQLSAGNLLILESIRCAARNNIHFYDFGRGSQKYKYEIFGAKNKYNKNVTICRTRMMHRVKSRIYDLFTRMPVVGGSTEPAVTREKI